MELLKKSEDYGDNAIEKAVNFIRDFKIDY
jgi:hypothetical protein